MNNNDLLKRLHTDSENILPTDALDPEAIEQSLVGVKRKNNKKIISSVSLIIFAICISTIIFAKPKINDIISPTETISKESNAKTSYKDIYKIIKKLPEYKNNVEYSYGIADGLTSSSVGQTNNYSETNIQVEGVDEADVVKTNGEYIFSVDYYNISITKIKDGKMSKITTIDSDFDISSIYIDDNKLFAVGTVYSESYGVVCSYARIGNGTTKINVFDISNINNPVKESDFTISGNYISSRKIGSVIYINTSYSVWNDSGVKKNKPETYCPVYSYGDETHCIDSSCITISNINYENKSIDYTTVTSINLNKPDEFVDMEAVFGTGYDVYSTSEHFYVHSYNYSNDNTEIFRFAIKDGDITPKGLFKSAGTVSDQFAMDEYNGYFRTVTQDYNKKNKTYLSIVSVFNSDTELVGQLKIPTGKETIRSVRFDENIAYFVTFETTDPLFTVNLSDPEKPEIISELKITGFSKYLHKINDNLMFGFGEKTNAKGRFRGLKLSLYDISDKNNVTEIDRLTFGSRDSWSEAKYNHKSVYIDKENNIIGIPYEDYEEINNYNSFNNYVDVYSYGIFKIDTENNRITDVKQIIYEKIDYASYAINNTRGVRIGEYFYIVTSDKIYSYDYDTFTHINTIKLRDVDY